MGWPIRPRNTERQSMLPPEKSKLELVGKWLSKDEEESLRVVAETSPQYGSDTSENTRNS